MFCREYNGIGITSAQLTIKAGVAMNISLRLFFLLSLTAAFPHSPAMVAPAQQPSVSLPPELARVLTDYENLWLHRDSAALARLFTEDGFVLSNGSPMVRGRVAIERFYSGPGAPLSLRAVAFATGGNVGYIIGAFTDRPGAPDRGNFTLTLRRDPSRRWLIMSDMDNGNGHASAP
jgi:ketosteroid isomerase-like protein